MRYRKRIIVAGEGGQGIQVVGEILAVAAYHAGLEALYIPNFGVEQRGGASIAFVQVSDTPVGAPKFRHADIMAVLSRRAFERTRMHQGPDTVVIYDSSDLKTPIIEDKTVGIQGWETVAPEAFPEAVGSERDPEPIPRGRGTLLPIPASDIAKSEFTPRVMNRAVLGAIISLAERISEDMVMQALEDKLGSKYAKDESLRELNSEAVRRGKAMAQQEMASLGARS